MQENRDIKEKLKGFHLFFYAGNNNKLYFMYICRVSFDTVYACCAL